VSEILKAINGEYSAIACYQHVAQLTPTKEEREKFLKSARTR
jgi:rubrerythrin